MAIFELANNWRGKFRSGDDGFAFSQTEAGFEFGRWRFAYIKRLHAEYEMPNDIAEIFYSYSQQHEYDQALHGQGKIEARDYRGEGFQLAYHWPLTSERFGNGFIQPQLSWLKLNDITWGSWQGDFRYRTNDDWDLAIDVDYRYRRDKLLRRGTAPGNPLARTYGELYTLGLAAQWQFSILRGSSARPSTYQIDYQGENLIAEINWPNLPATQARIDSQGAFFLRGFEFQQDEQLKPAATHWLNQRLDLPWLNSELTPALVSESYFNRIYSSHLLGLAVGKSENKLSISLAREFQRRAWQLQLSWKPSHASKLSARALSQSLNASRSQILSLQLGASFSF